MMRSSEKDTKLAQKLGQLEPFIAVFPQECMGQLAYFGPTNTSLAQVKQIWPVSGGQRDRIPWLLVAAVGAVLVAVLWGMRPHSVMPYQASAEEIDIMHAGP